MAIDGDNTWEDGALADAHVYSGLTYDYYFKRFDRRGLDGANRRMQTMVHPVRREDYPLYSAAFSLFFANAVYYGNGLMLYGVGLPPDVTASGRIWDHASGSLDIVAHEITHGVTEFTSDLIYLNESGALNESFSDIMSTSVEFFFHPAGDGPLRADYLCAEDVVRGPTNGIRSLADPKAYGHPDHYSVRFTGTSDNGGVHINSSIANHAFYLAIEGGTHRLSGVVVQGVGAPNRLQIERIFYRAFTQLLPSDATFAVARSATIQAARDLYGSGSAAERAVTEAWTAVGID
jgi:thermolysin